MQLSMYDIIKGPVLSDKAQKLNKQLRRLVLEVHKEATKPQIKDAIEKLFDVKVDRVCTLIRKFPPTKGFGARRQKSSVAKLKKAKIAYVTMKEGYSLDMFGHEGGAPVVDEQKNAGTAA